MKKHTDDQNRLWKYGSNFHGKSGWRNFSLQLLAYGPQKQPQTHKKHPLSSQLQKLLTLAWRGLFLAREVRSVHSMHRRQSRPEHHFVFPHFMPLGVCDKAHHPWLCGFPSLKVRRTSPGRWVTHWHSPHQPFTCHVWVGVRKAGKTYLMCDGTKRCSCCPDFKDWQVRR